MTDAYSPQSAVAQSRQGAKPGWRHRSYCPYLGLEYDPDTLFLQPVSEHRCKVQSEQHEIAFHHQTAFCLTSNFQHCTEFVMPVDDIEVDPGDWDQDAALQVGDLIRVEQEFLLPRPTSRVDSWIAHSAHPLLALTVVTVIGIALVLSTGLPFGSASGATPTAVISSTTATLSVIARPRTLRPTLLPQTRARTGTRLVRESHNTTEPIDGNVLVASTRTTPTAITSDMSRAMPTRTTAPSGLILAEASSSPPTSATSGPSPTITTSPVTPTPLVTPEDAAVLATPVLSVAVGEAVVTGPGLNMRDGPGTNYPILRDYPQGTRVNVLGKDATEAWLKVEANDGLLGWMAARYLSVTVPLGQVPIVPAPPAP